MSKLNETTPLQFILRASLFPFRLKTNIRNKRKLAFHEKGKFMDIGKKLRDKAKLELLKQEINKIAKKTGISSESKLALIQPKRFQVIKRN